MSLIRIFAVVLSILFAQNAFAQSTSVGFGDAPQDSSAPLEATSDDLFIDETSGTAVFSGNVVIIQGDMRLTAAKVEVFYQQDQQEIERMIATGSVVVVAGPDAAEADQAVYTLIERTVVMTGNVLMTQGPQILSGEKLTISLDDGTARMSGRVRTVLQGNN